MSSRFYDFVFYLREYWKPSGRRESRSFIFVKTHGRVVRTDVLFGGNFAWSPSCCIVTRTVWFGRWVTGVFLPFQRNSISTQALSKNVLPSPTLRRSVDPSPGASARCNFLSSRRLLSSTSTIYDALAPLIQCKCTCVHNTLLQFATITAAPSWQRWQRWRKIVDTKNEVTPLINESILMYLRNSTFQASRTH